MKSIISDYITTIQIWRELDYTTGEYISKPYFLGDGEGDFEESSFNTTKSCLEEYIKHCNEQIALATTLLNDHIYVE